MNLYKSSLLLLTLSPKKIGISLCSTLFIFNSAFPQGGTWTWISGSNVPNASGVYGTQGIPSVNNQPPREYEAVEFKDHQGNFWIYGGTFLNMSDLWKFNPVTLEWTWVKGDGQPNDNTVFGAQGISSPSNTPGQRTYCAASWVDTSGMFWLFGGGSSSNDLWKYDISTNEWTWMKGDTLGGAAVFGTQGIPSPSNTPSESNEECSAWTDSLNNLWLFGSGSSALWKFDISTLEWTWMNGDTLFGSPNYGVKGVADSSNDPGTRYSYTKWKDLKGNFWLMGGGGNDVWKYDLSINQWAWMSGPNMFGDHGSYQSNCIFSTVNWPYSRIEQRSSVTDNCGKFWLFGGLIDEENDCLNDLWVFDPQKLQWNWIAGTNVPNQSGDYGNLGVASLSNMPPSRCGADAWWGNDNKFYMFGGNTGPIKNYSDVWVFNPDTNCVSFSCNTVSVVPPIANFQSNKTTLCANDCVDFTDLSINNPVSWQWLFAGATDSTSTAQNPQGICYQSAGIYNVTLIATNAAGSDTVTFSNYIIVSPAPPTPAITQIGTTLYCSTNPSYTSYQWYLDSVLISGATDTSLIITQGGNYNVQVSNSSNCKIAVGINIILGIQNYMNDNLITLYPNPTTNQLSITGNWQTQTGKTTLTIFNTLGETIYTEELNSKPSTVNCKPFPSGIYFVQITAEKERWVGRFVKE